MDRVSSRRATRRRARARWLSSLVAVLGMSGGFASAADLIFVDGFEPRLATFAPPLSFVYEGDRAAYTIPEPLAARLHRPAASATVVSVTASDPALAVVGGGVTIPAGASDAIVLVDALAQHPGVTLTATLGGIPLTASVRVVGLAEMPALTDLRPPEVTVPPGGSVSFTVVLDIPAPPGGVLVDLGVIGGVGTVPPQVLVVQGQIEASFDLVAAPVVGEGEVSATLGAVSLTAVVHVAPGATGRQATP